MNKLSSTIFFSLVLFLSSCLNDVTEGSGNTKSPRGETLERSVLVYIIADNNNLEKFAREDVQEMAVGMREIDDTINNFLVYYDAGGEPELFRLSKDKKGNVVKEVIKEYPDQNSLDVDVMKGVFSDAFKNYPAENYSLVLWSHGEGWLEAPSTRFFGQDGKNYMNISDLKEVLTDNATPYFEYIYFDACFMSSVEVLYELRNTTDYFVVCPTETPGPGGPYDVIVPAMFDGKDAAVNMAGLYFNYYKGKYNGGVSISNSNWTGGVSISVIKTSELQGLATATRRILPTYLPAGEISTSGILCYDRRSSTRYYYDMDGLIKSIAGESNNDYKQWKTAYNKAVVYFDTTEKNYSQYVQMFSMTGSTGLSIYIPRISQASLLTYYKTYEWYQAGGWADTGW